MQKQGIRHIHVEAVDDVPQTIASKVITWGHADPNNVLILPASPEDLIRNSTRCHRDDIKYIQSSLKVSGVVAHELWLAFLSKEALRIDPRTAEIFEERVYVDDPYGISDGPGHCTGSFDFVRAPGSDIWVLRQDLPKKTQRALDKLEKKGRLNRLAT